MLPSGWIKLSTDHEDVFRLSETDRRHSSAFRIGVVEEADYPAGKVRVRMSADALTGWLPFAALRAGALRVWSPPSIGEQVMIQAPAGELNQAIVLPGIYRNQFPAPSIDPMLDVMVWDDGSSVSYNRATQEVKITSVGNIRATAPMIYLN